MFNLLNNVHFHKTQLAVVVSNHAAWRFDAVVQVVPITTLQSRWLRPSETRIDSDSSGIKNPSRAIAIQLGLRSEP